MPRAEDAGLVRAYDRNVGWCRFWLGVSLAIATLTFTFAVDQVFDVPIEPLEVSDTEQKSASGNDSGDPIGFSDMAALLTLTLIGIAGLCIGLSAYFKVLYYRDDAALLSIERDGQEATP